MINVEIEIFIFTYSNGFPIRTQVYNVLITAIKIKQERERRWKWINNDL